MSESEVEVSLQVPNIVRHPYIKDAKGDPDSDNCPTSLRIPPARLWRPRSTTTSARHGIECGFRV